ncbi:hypothetical protein EDB83DRAFT_2680205 [Lactarius deliciosus]|nr:hypothetical protein EDB83DRAFT_2680205 [Lactarius deliciosus]
MGVFTPFRHTIPTTDCSSRMSFTLFSRKKRIPGPRPATSDDQPLAHGAVVYDPVWHVGTRGDVTMSAIQTSLAVLKEGSALAARVPFIAPIAGLLLQALIMRDEVRQYKEECEIVVHKLARIAKIIVGVGELCESHNLSEEDLPTGLRAILGSLQKTRELDRIERVLKKCSKRKGIKGILLRKDLFTKIKQCDVEISNVLQAFHVELSLDTRVALIAMRREAAPDSGPVEEMVIPPASGECCTGIFGHQGLGWSLACHNTECQGANYPSRPSHFGPDLMPNIPITFFFLNPDEHKYKYNTKFPLCYSRFHNDRYPSFRIHRRTSET